MFVALSGFSVSLETKNSLVAIKQITHGIRLEHYVIHFHFYFDTTDSDIAIARSAKLIQD